MSGGCRRRSGKRIATQLGFSEFRVSSSMRVGIADGLEQLFSLNRLSALRKVLPA